ncbi:MAG: 50S ribosomal protein L24, partial [Dehalococcoidia bacterium]|nr:50S ribosomal protein L24 [Dehalococcoidia bacterium]
MRRIKRDDLVMVISGKERGKQGQVREVLRERERVIVQGLNMVKRHQRQR